MDWNDIVVDRYGSRYSLDGASLSDVDEIFNAIATQINNFDFNKQPEIINFHLVIQGGIVDIFPCKKKFLDREIELSFSIQFNEIMESYSLLEKSSISDQDFDAKLEQIVRQTKKLFESKARQLRLKFDFIFTDIEFNAL
ncbi:hypothetical protein [Aliikangiella maris]|uniref:Uncharacterized protein n=2 Tax=Aliikangiella maris TaxID=3162458 RepID=A0ABV3MVF3_9GAMM